MSHYMDWAFDDTTFLLYTGLVRFSSFCAESPNLKNNSHLFLVINAKQSWHSNVDDIHKSAEIKTIQTG